MKTKTKLNYQEMPTEYVALCRNFIPRPIHDDIDYTNTVEICDTMAPWHTKFNKDQADYFSLLCSLIETYDAKRIRWPSLTGVDLLKHLLDEGNLSGADLSKILGSSRTLGSMILRGDRKLTLNHVRLLSKHFNLPADVFSQGV